MSNYITCSIIIALLLSSCSSNSQNPQVFTVEIKDMKFVPDDLTVNKGDTVLWINKDIITHDVTEERTKAWTSSVIQSGKSWKMAITNPADYYCSIHVVMKGKVRVK